MKVTALLVAGSAATAGAIRCYTGYLYQGCGSGQANSQVVTDCSSSYERCQIYQTKNGACTVNLYSCATVSGCNTYDGVTGYSCCDTELCNGASTSSIGAAAAVVAAVVAYSL